MLLITSQNHQSIHSRCKLIHWFLNDGKFYPIAKKQPFFAMPYVRFGKLFTKLVCWKDL